MNFPNAKMHDAKFGLNFQVVLEKNIDTCMLSIHLHLRNYLPLQKWMTFHFNLSEALYL